MINLIEMIADDDECGWDTPCKHGHHVRGHAIYCHNDDWADSPRKCRRGPFSFLDETFQDCPGFCPNDQPVSDFFDTAKIGEGMSIRGDYLHKDAAFRLVLAAETIRDAFPDSYGVFLVGSVLDRPDYRDVDVRCIMPDDEFDALFPGLHGSDQPWHARFTLLCFSVTAWLRHMTDLPIDFQFQRSSQVNEKYGDKRRHAIGNVRVSAPDAA